MIHRMMYHRHILTRNNSETIRKIYEKQKEETTKGDWYQLLKEDFEFVEEELNEEEIVNNSKEEYAKKVKQMVKKAAFKLYKEKQESLKKIKDLKYDTLELNDYLRNKTFTREERELLVRLRSKCHDAKVNFRKMNKNNVNCSFGCNEIESQEHIFSNCLPLKTCTIQTEYENLDKETKNQKTTISVYVQIEQRRKKAKEALLPGGDFARTHAGLLHIDYATV